MHKSLLAFLGLTSSVFAAQNANCAPEPSATCYPDDCKSCYCLGPADIITNAPVCPMTCNGDWDLTLAGFYWTTHEDGLEYAINNETLGENDQEPLINANFEAPNFKWDFGFKLGLGYCTTCDGWDFGATWTWFKGHANSHIEREDNDQCSLIPLWSPYSTLDIEEAPRDIETRWQVEMNLIDLDLGRNFWVSKYLALRPHVGLRISHLNQDYSLEHKGAHSDVNTVVDLDNDFKGVGVRVGLDSTWNFGCGWALFGSLATSIVYGRFDIDHDETSREITSPFKKEKWLEAKDSFRASRAMLDYALGVQWTGMFCDCQYGLTIGLAFEQHLFFHQNQLWRTTSHTAAPLNFDKIQDVFSQSRGTLDTHGFTLTVDFAF